MTRIAVASDLHIEFERAGAPNPPAVAGLHPAYGPDLAFVHGEADFLVLAGDIDLGANSILYADEAARFLEMPVACVLGNHEAYGSNLEQVIADCRRAADGTEGRVLFLEEDAAEMAGVRLLGCVLWTDYEINGDREAGMHMAAGTLNDHRLITCGGHPFTPVDALDRHRRARSWLEGELAGGSELPIVVVTHHAPVRVANAPEHVGSALRPAFVSDLEDIIETYEPAAWIWGHTHYSVDTAVGKTRCISAQRGYPGVDPLAAGFRPAIIEV
jgi:predicted phosphodiesterase